MVLIETVKIRIGLMLRTYRNILKIVGCLWRNAQAFTAPISTSLVQLQKRN